MWQWRSFLYVGYSTVCILLVSLSHCYLLYVFCSLLCSNWLLYFLIYSFFVSFLVLYVLLSILCVLHFYIVVCIVSHHVYSCVFYIRVQFYRSLPPVGHPIAVNKYIIIPYHIIISYHIYHIISECFDCPVSIISSFHHTHSPFICHRHYSIILASNNVVK